jgi:hypothetical protein
MLEDATTKSWWRQVTGEAITGKLKENNCQYSTPNFIGGLARLNPNSLIMQPMKIL